MNSGTRAAARDISGQQAAAAFKAWVHRVVSGAAELRALADGELDAIIDPATGNAVMLPEAQAVLNGSRRIVRNAFDALPGGVCVLDADGTVVMTNKVWRAFAAGHAGAGIGVGEGDNFLAACRRADKFERAHARAVASGLREVIVGARLEFRHDYVCRSPQGESAFTLIVTGPSADSIPHIIVTRENVRDPRRMPKPRKAERTRPRRLARAVPSNRLLAVFRASEQERLLGGLEPVTLRYGDVLYQPGERMRHVYFPDDCLVSLLTIVEGHRALEVSLVGREGMIGSRLAFGIAESPVRALVQGTGSAARLPAAGFLAAFRESQPFRQALFRFTDALMNQVSQTAACNRFHVIEERLAYWLLMTRERLPRDEFHLTHEFLADMLGVRRVGVTKAAGSLRRRGLIRYRRGNIRILDQRGLESAACSCYRRVRIVECATEIA